MPAPFLSDYAKYPFSATFEDPSGHEGFLDPRVSSSVPLLSENEMKKGFSLLILDMGSMHVLGDVCAKTKIQIRIEVKTS